MKIFSIISTIVAATVFSLTASAQIQQGSGTGDMTVVIQEQAPITFTQNNAIDFGVIVPFGSSGIITIFPDGRVNSSNLLRQVEPRAGSWTITGVENAPFDLVLPTSVTITNETGETMTVTSFSRTDNNNPLSFDGSGQQAFNVGAALSVNPNQAPGNYTGQYTITASYN